MFSWDNITRDGDNKVVLLYRHQRIFDEGVVQKGDKVLDLGGWGVLATSLIEAGNECIILDNFSEDQYYPDRVKSLPHIDGDILHSDDLEGWGESTYDVVTCFEMLEHCLDQSLGLINMNRMLKPGGRIVGTFPLPGAAHAADDPTVTFLTEEELRELLTNAGFNDLLIEKTGSVSRDEKPSSLYFKGVKQ